MFLWDYISGLLYSLGLYKKSGKLLFLGLDNSGNYLIYFYIRLMISELLFKKTEI